MDEQQAIQQLKCGEIGGLEYLVRQYQVKAVRTAYLITRDPGLAEDIVQDCFLQAFRSIHGFDAARPFGPRFLKSVVNASVKAVQKANRQSPLREAEQDSLFTDLSAQIESVELQVEAVETRDQIWEAMMKLSARQRAVIVQRYFLEMSEAEMAAESGIAVGTVKWLLNAARSHLRQILTGRSRK